MPAWDADAYRKMEHDGYEAVAADYDRWLAVVTARFADPLLDLATPRNGDRVLDAACGPGVLTSRLLPRIRPDGRCTGIDFSERMIGLARAHLGQDPAAGFEVMDVERLEFAAATFDLAVCGFGLMHFPDAGRALAELRRVLKPGGRIALSVWAELPRVEFMATILTAVKAVAPDAGFPPGPPMFGYGTPAALQPLLDAAGFTRPLFREVGIELEFPTFDHYWNALVLGAARLGGVVRALPADRQAALRDRVAGALAPRRSGEGYTLRGAAQLAMARVPEVRD